MIKVYSKPDCKYCVKLKEWLATQEIDYKDIDVSEHPEAREKIIEQGYRTVPIVEVDGVVVSHEPYTNILDYLAGLSDDYDF